MTALLIWTLSGIGLGVLCASFFEWTLHKYVMHRPVGKFRYAFHAHAVVHHQTFKADHTYHLIEEKDQHTIPMAWWNGPVLVVLAALPTILAGIIAGIPALAISGFLTCAAYYGAYEYMHWCMHLPKNRHIERPWFFRRLNGHHLLHHRYMHKNFNVVLPLADLLMGTLLLRSKVKFKQAEGPAVPNVQPRHPGPVPA